MAVCYLRLFVWDALAQRFAPVASGFEIEALAGEHVSRPIARGVTDKTGLAVIRVPGGDHSRHGVWFRCQTPTAVFDSRHETVLDDPDVNGIWTEIGSGLGTPDTPIGFDIEPKRRPMMTGNSIGLLVDGPETLAHVEELIAEAEHHIHLDVQYFMNDVIGRRVLDQLLARARAGIEVRVMFDSETMRRLHSVVAMQLHWIDHWLDPRMLPFPDLRDRLIALGRDARTLSDTSEIVARIAGTPNASYVDSYIVDHVLSRELASRHVAGLNPRRAVATGLIGSDLDHGKVLVVDGRCAVIGSHNVGLDHLYDSLPSDTVGIGHWHDVSLALHGPIVNEVQRLFRARWIAQGGDSFDAGKSIAGRAQDLAHPYFPVLEHSPGGITSRIARTVPGVHLDIRDTLLELMSAARDRIIVETPYFNSSEVTDHLVAASRRGVAVTTIFPHYNNAFEYLYTGRLRYRNLIRAGVSVHEYLPRMSHAKLAVIDDIAVIGSPNLNRPSLEYHHEIAAVLDDGDLADHLVRSVIETDLEHSRRIREDDVHGLLDIAFEASAYVHAIAALG